MSASAPPPGSCPPGSGGSGYMLTRRLENAAAFLIPHLKPGLKILDGGCGPGSITLDIARKVGPDGTVVAVDLDEPNLELVRKTAKEEGLENVVCQQGSIFELPFEDDTFDIAFSNAVFQHLVTPQKAAQELYRVTKQGGVLAVRANDWGGFLMAPQSEELLEALSWFRKINYPEGDPYVGSKLKGILLQAGCEEVDFSATSEVLSVLLLNGIAGQLENAALTSNLALDQDNAKRLADAVRSLTERKDAVIVSTWCEVIGKK